MRITRSLMKEAHEKGSPIMRTMFYEFPKDDICWELKDQYMYGSDLLVAPVVQENAVVREVYLPGGAFWISLHDRKRYEGGQTIEAIAPIGEIPVFIRNGNAVFEL